MPLASLLHDRFLTTIAKGRGGLDWAAIALGVAEDAGLATLIGGGKNSSPTVSEPSGSAETGPRA
jgi:hypothetical protein